VEFVSSNFLAVRVHVQRNRDEYKELAARYNAQWTPTILILDSTGQERHRIEGFLPADDFLAQLELGAAQLAMARQDFPDAEQRFRGIIERDSQSEVAAEAMYWAGVARYKATGDAAALKATANDFRERHAGSTWAKKASVWAAP
jgi:thioredoxin-related protein